MPEIYNKLLTFYLHNECYGISILKVREVIGMMEIIKLPQTPNFIKGVINLRGKIIPVMDLRTKFGIEEQEISNTSCIIIVEVKINEQSKNIGFIIDAIKEVITISSDQIEQAPSYGENCEDGVISGIGKMKDKIVIILDVDKILLRKEIVQILENLSRKERIKEVQNV